MAAGEAIRRLTRHPQLWAEAWRMVWSLRRGGWQGARRYLAWRRHTAYGSSATAITAADLESFLVWRRAFRRVP